MVCLYPTKPNQLQKPFVCARCHLNVQVGNSQGIGEMLIVPGNSVKRLKFSSGRLHFCITCAWAVKDYMEGTVLN